mmetsp:Transcript_49489/g.92204  ORF Transcript_49489/g.92204 Transcript_49489/m.92204 type:complete len:207 (-) Transcript_49489:700-1320(-)
MRGQQARAAVRPEPQTTVLPAPPHVHFPVRGDGGGVPASAVHVLHLEPLFEEKRHGFGFGHEGGVAQAQGAVLVTPPRQQHPVLLHGHVVEGPRRHLGDLAGAGEHHGRGQALLHVLEVAQRLTPRPHPAVFGEGQRVHAPGGHLPDAQGGEDLHGHAHVPLRPRARVGRQRTLAVFVASPRPHLARLAQRQAVPPAHRRLRDLEA